MDELGLYQIALSDQVAPYLDPGFSPLDWRHNPHPELREIAIHAHIGRSELYRRHRLTGAFSAKFYAKTGLRSEGVAKWIQENPGYDIYLISGHPFLPYFGYNSVERGCFRLGKNFESILRAFGDCVGSRLPDKLWRQTNNNSAYCSYWVASQGFWERWHGDVIECITSEDRLGSEFFRTVHSRVEYIAGAPPVSYAPFVYELYMSLYITINNIKAIYYDWSQEEILNLRLSPEVRECLTKIMPGIDDLDRNGGWTEENATLPMREYLEMRRTYPGFMLNCSDRQNYNLPSARFPRS
jgi:hypothetical protein